MTITIWDKIGDQVDGANYCSKRIAHFRYGVVPLCFLFEKNIYVFGQALISLHVANCLDRRKDNHCSDAQTDDQDRLDTFYRVVIQQQKNQTNSARRASTSDKQTNACINRY